MNTPEPGRVSRLSGYTCGRLHQPTKFVGEWPAEEVTTPLHQLPQKQWPSFCCPASPPTSSLCHLSPQHLFPRACRYWNNLVHSSLGWPCFGDALLQQGPPPQYGPPHLCHVGQCSSKLFRSWFGKSSYFSLQCNLRRSGHTSGTVGAQTNASQPTVKEKSFKVQEKWRQGQSTSG